MAIKEKDKEPEKFSILLEDLASLESYARDLFSFLPLPVCLVSPIGIILEGNPAFETITGYKIEELIGRPIETVFDERTIKELADETSKTGLVKAREVTVFPKDRKKIPVNASTVLRKSEEGEIIGYFIGFFDLTEIKQREEELKKTQTALLNILEDIEKERKIVEEEKNKTLAMINTFADGLLFFDNENKLSLINPQAEIFFKIKGGEIAGKSISELKGYSTFQPLVKLVEKEAKRIFRKEIKVQDGFILEVTTTSVMMDKSLVGTLIILHDITREKVIERMKTEFVSIAAHQLRTPLAAIKWTLKMLLDGDLGEITGQQRDFVAKTYRSNERMISLINDLLNVTRIEEGRYLYKPVLANVEETVQSVVNSYKEAALKKKLKLELKKPKKKLPKARVDAEKIKLAIENLIDNAVRYTDSGGSVTVSFKSGTREIKVMIRDTGVGIPKDQQKRVFTKFFRGANAIRMETEGSGLGLFITKNIIEAHGGKIWFESEEKKGTTFYFTLPVTEESEEF